MSFRQIKLNYCAQCKQIDKELVYNCRWLNLSFCRINCLKQFYDRIASQCDLCKNQLNYKRIHLRDDVKNINLFTFVCDECFKKRKPLAIYCHNCSNVCYNPPFGDAFALTQSGLIAKFVCSSDCKIDENRLCETLSCSECNKRAKCDQVVHGGNTLRICSKTCFGSLEQRLKIKFGMHV